LIASHTGWSHHYIARELPLALGLQIILFHNLREGLPMRWSNDIGGDEDRAAVDIMAEMKRSIANANKSRNGRD
jgi:hypothetical protein